MLALKEFPGQLLEGFHVLVWKGYWECEWVDYGQELVKNDDVLHLVVFQFRSLKVVSVHVRVSYDGVANFLHLLIHVMVYGENLKTT